MGRGNQFLCDQGVILRGIDIYIRGSNNRITIKQNSTLRNCTVKVYGNNNRIEINDNCLITNGIFWIEDDFNSILIGNHVTVNGETEFATMEGTCIRIGDDCMFSSDISLRTGDSHSVLDLYGKRINLSADITLQKHIWIGARSTILKGAYIESNSIIGTGAIVTKRFSNSNVAIAGNPAEIIKCNVNWDRKRIL